MLNRRDRKGGKLLRSFFFTYFIVLILPLTLAILCYQEALRIVEKDIEYENQALLTQASEILDTRVEELRNIGTQLVSSSQMLTLRYITQPFEYPNTAKIITARSTMTKYAAFNDFIFDYLLYFNNGQYVLNDQSVYSYEDFYKLYMHAKDQTYEQWLAQIQDTQAAFGECKPVTVSYLRGGTSTPVEMDLVGFHYSFFPYDHNDGCAVIYVKQESLLDLIARNDLSEGSTFLENSQGQLIASRMAEDVEVTTLQAALDGIEGDYSIAQRSIGGRSMLLTQITSPQTGLRIVIALSSDAVYARLTSLRQIIYCALGLAFLAGAIICYVLSKRNARLVRSISREGGDRLLDMTYGNAFKSLQASFSNIQLANEAMNETLVRQKSYLLHTFLSRLIEGDFRSEDEATVMAKTVGAFETIKPMQIVLFRLHSGSSSSDTLTLQLTANCKAIIKLAIDATEKDQLSIDRSEEDFVLLLSGDRLRERTDALVKLIRGKLPESMNEMLYVYVGNTVDRLTDVVRSYANASSLIYIKPSPAETPALFFDSSEYPKYAMFYPRDMRHHLINCTMNGDEEGMLNLLELLKQRNLSDAELPSFMRQLFIDNLLNTLLQVTTLSGLPSSETEAICARIQDLMGMELSTQVEQIDQLFLLLYQAVQRQKSGKQQCMIESVKAYLDANYADYDLSLAHVAEKFNVSESYLSYTFKLQGGVNFFSYLESIRMANAKELLKHTGLKISEVAKQVGYASANSFCRAFKRSTGDSASAYRNSME